MPRVRSLLILGLTVGAVLTACSNDDKSTTQPTPTTAVVSEPLPTPTGSGTDETPNSTPTASDTGEPGSSTPTSSDSVDGCKLVTQADADKLTGLSLNPPTSTDGVCVYTAPPSGPTGQVEVYTGDKGEAQLTSARAGSATLTALNGIGDEAYIAPFSVYFRKGDTWVAILLVKTEDPALTRTALEDLATVAVGRL